MSIYFDLTKTNISYKFVDPTVLSDDQMSECQKYFDEEVSKNPKLFNAKKFASKEFQIKSGSEIFMEVCETDYMKYVWSRSNSYFVQGLSPISVDSLFYDDEYIYMLTKSNATQYTKGGVDTIGGTVEFSDEVTESGFEDFLINHALEEIEEEVEYEGPKITSNDLKPFVACFNTRINKLDKLFLVKRSLIKPKNWEGKEIEKVKIKELEVWMNQNKSRIPEIMGNYLYYFANKLSLGFEE